MTVYVSPSQGGNVKIDGTIPDSYPYNNTPEKGSSVSLEAIPANGFKFTGWTGSEVSSDNSISTEMTCDKTITASFVQEQGYFLNMDVNGNGSVTPSIGSHSYSQGEVVTITAVPDKGQEFTSWTGKVKDPGSASTTVTLDESRTVIANFSVARHTLTTEVNGTGSVNPSPGRRSYTEGSTVKLVATPDEGSQFKGWAGNVSDPSSESTTIVINSDQTIIANFSGGEFVLTLETVGKGTVTPSTGDYPYTDGTSIEITAMPDDGSIFEGWIGDVSDNLSPTTTVTIDNYKTITATFTRILHTLMINREGEGSVTPATGTHDYYEDETVTLTATPDTGHVFSGWEGEVADPNSSSTSIIMDSDKSVVAKFSRVYTLSVAVEGEGSISPEQGIHDYAEGASITISATPGDGYKFTGWTGDLSYTESPTVTMTIDSDKAVTAVFTKSGLAPWIITIIVVAVVAIIGGIVWFASKKPKSTE